MASKRAGQVGNQSMKLQRDHQSMDNRHHQSHASLHESEATNLREDTGILGANGRLDPRPIQTQTKDADLEAGLNTPGRLND